MIRPAIVVAYIVYTVAMLAWLVFVLNAARLEADVGARFVRLTAWPDRVTLLGLVWTALLVAAVLAAIQMPRPWRAASLGTITLCSFAVAELVPASFRALGYFGVSTSEFLDAMFLPLGGALPGGQATIGLWLLRVVLAALTLAAALPLRIRT